MSVIKAAQNFHTLSPEVILNVVEQALGEKLTNLCRPLNSYVNRVYELSLSQGGGVIAKFYRPGRWSHAALQDEHDFLLELYEHEIPVIPPLKLVSGGTLGQHGEMFFAVFPKKGGRTTDEFTMDQWEEIGRLLGRVHAVGATRLPRDRSILTPGEVTRTHISFLVNGGFIKPPSLATRYSEVTTLLLDTITPLFAEVNTIRIHGDCHFSNIIHRPGESFYLIDLDDMTQGPPVQDFWMLLPGYAHECGSEIESFLEGYETFRPFDRRTLSLIEPLRAMRYIHYSAWCAWQVADNGFVMFSEDWGSPEYWQREIRDLEEQIVRIREDGGRLPEI